MLSRRLFSDLIRGLEQQLWFWGQDARELSQNKLVEYGFRRYRTAFQGGSHRYQTFWGTKVVELHSYCAGIYGGDEHGFIYIRAHDQVYAYTGQTLPWPGRYRQSWLIPPSDSRARLRVYEASREFLEWMEHYESWIENTFGSGYREECYRKYHRPWLSPRLVREWFYDYRYSPEKRILDFSKRRLLSRAA